MDFFDKKPVNDVFLVVNGITVNGDFEGSVPGRIEGIVKGDVKINNKVIISATGIVQGSVKCCDLIVDGLVHGDAVAYNSISIGQTGSVYGNVRSNSITIHPKSKVKGSINQIRNHGAPIEKLNEKPLKEINLNDTSDSKESYW